MTFPLEGKRFVAALGLAAVTGLSSTAQAAVIDGVNVGTGILTFVATTIMEDAGPPNGTLITGDGQVLRGLGVVTEIRSDGVLVWSPTLTDELTIMFGGYTSTGFTPTAVGFTGGSVQFFHDTSGSSPANFVNGTGFGEGSLWLDLIGVAFDNPLVPGSCTGVTLCGGGDVLGPSISVTGTGLLEVTLGGLADAYFNTNTIVAGGTGNVADWEINSSVSNLNPIGFLFQTHGTASISNFRVVPEPSTPALLAIGLLAISFGVRVFGRAK